MPPFRHWEDLPPELLCRIGDILDLKFYSSARGACTAWRSALLPLSPSLLVVLDSARRWPSATSLATRRTFELKPIRPGGRCVGSSNGWLALTSTKQGMFILFNPITAAEIALPPLTYGSGWVSKIVFAPNPAADDFTAAAICDSDRLAYVTAGAKRWAILDPVPLDVGDRLADVTYHENGTVYCLTFYGDVHMLRLSLRRRREPIPTVVAEDSAGPSSVPGKRRYKSTPVEQHRDMLHRLSAGQDLNLPATVKPLLSELPADCFAPPFDTIYPYTSVKNLVLCKGIIYQIWRNGICRITLQQPGGGHRHIEENEVFVLRYYPRRLRKPCWDAVTDLGGYSMFVGRNNGVSMFAKGIMGLKANCIYWVGGRNRDQGMVFDMATGMSTPCLPADGWSAICWYFG